MALALWNLKVWKLKVCKQDLEAARSPFSTQLSFPHLGAPQTMFFSECKINSQLPAVQDAYVVSAASQLHGVTFKFSSVPHVCLLFSF